MAAAVLVRSEAIVAMVAAKPLRTARTTLSLGSPVHSNRYPKRPAIGSSALAVRRNRSRAWASVTASVTGLTGGRPAGEPMVSQWAKASGARPWSRSAGTAGARHTRQGDRCGGRTQLLGAEAQEVDVAVAEVTRRDDVEQAGIALQIPGFGEAGERIERARRVVAQVMMQRAFPAAGGDRTGDFGVAAEIPDGIEVDRGAQFGFAGFDTVQVVLNTPFARIAATSLGSKCAR